MMESEDLSAFLPYGKVTDYPLSEQESQCHFKDSIHIKSKQINKLCESEIFNVICDQPQCVDVYKLLRISRFDGRMSYLDWVNNHHLVKHPNIPKSFQIASFWSTIYNGHALCTEYQLISRENYKYLKPLNKIYSSYTDSSSSKQPSPCHHCAYCKVKKTTLNRCGGCKILFYCSKQCQKKHWDLIHKKECKKWKKKFKNKTLTKEQIDDLEMSSLLKLKKISVNYYGPLIDAYKEMMRIRSQNNKENKEELLFPDGESNDLIIANNMMSVVINAFDRDGDGKLNFKEWKVMMNELGFGYIDKAFFYDISQDFGCLPFYSPSLNNGCYGHYLYDNNNIKEVCFGAKQIMEILKYCAYWRTISENNEDEDFKDVYDLYDDERTAYYKATRLLFKLYGHAQNILCLGDHELLQQDLLDIILTAVPYLNIDIVLVIYNYTTMNGQYIINISWHRIKWLNYKEDQQGLWELYDRKINYYDIFYLFRTDDRGYSDIQINVAICNDVEKCNKKLKKLTASPFGFSQVDFEERLHFQQKWCLGTTPSYIPDYSFTLKEHAVLIANVLQIHNLNPRLCHYIYVGTEFNLDIDSKSKIVDHFNEIYNSNTKYRPQKPKKPSALLSEFDMDIF